MVIYCASGRSSLCAVTTIPLRRRSGGAAGQSRRRGGVPQSSPGSGRRRARQDGRGRPPGGGDSNSVGSTARNARLTIADALRSEALASASSRTARSVGIETVTRVVLLILSMLPAQNGVAQAQSVALVVYVSLCLSERLCTPVHVTAQGWTLSAPAGRAKSVPAADAPPWRNTRRPAIWR
jgi:hypothetical protein